MILRAAIAVFARSGYHTSRVADVAKEAGVAYGLVYHYFGSKEELLDTIFRRTWTRMLEAVEEIERSGQSAREQLAAVARIVLGAWEMDPDLVRVLVREVARSPQLGREVDEIEHAFAALERIVAAVKSVESCGPSSTAVSPPGSSTARSRRSSPAGCTGGSAGADDVAGRAHGRRAPDRRRSRWIDSSINAD